MARPKKGRANDVLLAALACGASKQAAAQQAGVSVSTVYRRLDDAAFQRQLKEFRADVVERTSAALTAAGLEFVKTLVSVAGSTAPPATCVAAARAGLELGMKVREATDLEQRLAALEQVAD